MNTQERLIERVERLERSNQRLAAGLTAAIFSLSAILLLGAGGKTSTEINRDGILHAKKLFWKTAAIPTAIAWNWEPTTSNSAKPKTKFPSPALGYPLTISAVKP